MLASSLSSNDSSFVKSKTANVLNGTMLFISLLLYSIILLLAGREAKAQIIIDTNSCSPDQITIVQDGLIEMVDMSQVAWRYVHLGLAGSMHRLYGNPLGTVAYNTFLAYFNAADVGSRTTIAQNLHSKCFPSKC